MRTRKNFSVAVVPDDNFPGTKLKKKQKIIDTKNEKKVMVRNNKEYFGAGRHGEAITTRSPKTLGKQSFQPWVWVAGSNALALPGGSERHGEPKALPERSEFINEFDDGREPLGEPRQRMN